MPGKLQVRRDPSLTSLRSRHVLQATNADRVALLHNQAPFRETAIAALDPHVTEACGSQEARNLPTPDDLPRRVRFLPRDTVSTRPHTAETPVVRTRRSAALRR